jgi:virginiamycin B lyase
MSNAPSSARARPRRWLWLLLILIVALAVLGASLFVWHGGGGVRKAEVVEYRMLAERDVPTALAVAPDGTVWFTIDLADAVGRVHNGKVERFSDGKANLEPIGIAAAADGSAWYTDAPAKQVTRISPSGELTSVALETPVAQLGQIAVAPDGAVWFAEAHAFSITRLKDGQLTRHVIDAPRAGPLGVAVAGDGTVWATLQTGNQLLRIGADDSMKMFEIPTRGSSPSDLVIDRQGAVWFLEFRGNKLGRLKDGGFEEVSLGQENVGPTGLAMAPDGAVWFGMLRQGSLGRYRDGKIVQYRLPRERSRPYSVGADQAGNIWYTDITGYVGMLPAKEAQR